MGAIKKRGAWWYRFWHRPTRPERSSGAHRRYLPSGYGVDEEN